MAAAQGMAEAHASHVHSASSNDTSGKVAPADAVVINLPIVSRATALTREDLRVTQGETVRLSVTADEPGEIHLHGYNLKANVSPENPGELVFEATTAGAFGINFHVFQTDGMTNSNHADGDGHHAGPPTTLISEVPISVSITADPDAHGGVDVHITAVGFRFAPESVDQPHTPGAGHAHIYVDGEKLGRAFEPDYHIADLAPGQHEIRVALNTNDHSELIFDGSAVDATAIVTVPNVGQATGDGDSGDDHAGHDNHEREVVAEVHLGNLEVHP